MHLDIGQYLALWRHLGLGEHPLLLSVLDHGRTYAERDALDAAGRDRLAAQGLLDDPSLADMLSVLAAPTREVDVRVLVEGAPPLGVVAATRGALGVVAWLVPGGLRLDPADPDEPAGALLARLPDRPAAPGVAMSLPADALLGDGVTLDERGRCRLRRAGVSAHHVERLHAMWAAPPERSATFGVAVRDAAGVRRRGPRVITVLDTASGRLAMGPDATGSRIVVRPNDRPRLRAELAALLEGHERDVATSFRRR